MKKSLIFIFSLFTIHYSLAQKKPLDHSVYDSWQHIGERMISNDGKWVVYTIDPQEGDNELVIQSSDAKYKKTVPRGYNALITEDSRYVVFKIKPFYKDTREARIKKKKPADMPKDSLAIVELGKEEIWKREKIKGYKAPQKSFGWIAYQLEEQIKQPGGVLKPTKKDSVDINSKRISDSLSHVIDSLNSVITELERSKKKKNKNKDEVEDEIEIEDAEGDDPASGPADSGNDLVLRNNATGEEIVFYNVLEYYFSKTNEQLLVEMARNPRDSFSFAQVMLYDCKMSKAITLSKKGNEFKNFAMTDDGSQIAYVAERDAKPKDLQKFYKLWYYQSGIDSAIMLVDRYAVGMKLGMTISEYGNLNFSKSGKRLFFGTAPIQPPRDTTIVDFEKPKVDIWHYKDDYLQTVQNFPARLRAAQQENFLAVYNFETSSIKQLGSKEIPQVLQTNEGDGDQFVGVTDFGKRIESQWRGNTLKDIYAIDVNTGKNELVKENLFGQVYPSPTGKFILWYDRKAKDYFLWNGYTSQNISSKIKYPLWSEDAQNPEEPANYGIMGWHEDDEAVYIYDRYDIWRIKTDHSSHTTTMTKGFGRSAKNILRLFFRDSEKRFFSDNDELYIRLQNDKTKEYGLAVAKTNGYFSEFDYPDNKFLPPITIAEKEVSGNRTFIYTKETYERNPDLYFCLHTSQGGLEDPAKPSVETVTDIKLSSINPQQSNYLWGTAELFNWKAYDGKEAAGIVYKPENFDPKKKYPMIVYFYEKLSSTLYDYKEPAPIRSAVNVPYFVSNGYVIFIPDINYTTGHPGQNAYDYIVSGSRALVKKGWVDSTNMALQGHSWGGYQAAQVATMTKLFKAVWAGAPVANMTSAYGGIRWESGVNRQFQYETGQSRIGGTLWEKLPLYLENSPLFHLDKVTAPMVIMANDADGAVPWYQGIEMFTALRRLGKKVWMFNYNGQGHGLTQRQDMRDYQIRMQQFFDWILKGEKPAKWITEGVPAVKKGKEWGLEVE
ncbi:MAG: S9 family peptidase [Chitinophagaceae bacterium]|nr:S9 family peptidase [Chitinophagaceae bacterium]